MIVGRAGRREVCDVVWEKRRWQVPTDRKVDRLSRQALRILVFPVVLICLAAVVPGLLMLRTAGPDLFDLTPTSPRVDGYVLVAWHELERAPGALKQGELSSGSPTRVLGYMMEADAPVRNGQHVQRFVLLPDAGSALHPAHRFGDQMVEVHLKGGDSIPFAAGRLVWVWGTWKLLPGNPNRDKALYQLEDARVENASRLDIAKYFR